MTNKEMDELLRQRHKRKVRKRKIIISIIALIIISFFVIPKIAGPIRTSYKPNETTLNYYGTVDGYDSASGTIIDPINIWTDYNNRRFAGKVRHGERVKLIKRVGDGVLIEKENGKRGWLTYFFIDGLTESK